MTRFSILAVALVLAACEPVPHVVPGSVSDAYAQALEAHDVDAALSTLEAHADAGDLYALAELADVRSRGYLRAPYKPGIAGGNLPIRTWPWSGPLATRRFEAALQDSIAAGSQKARFLLADRHLARWVHGEQVTPDVDAAREQYARLEAAGADPMRLAFLARGLGDEAGYIRHLGVSAQAGQRVGCMIHYYATREDVLYFTAAMMADEIDTITACQARGDGPVDPVGRDAVESLVEQRALGNAEAEATIDSLNALGVFERHAHLRAVVEAAG